nr:hypothetical protein [Tanacetum cinerariifolium]GFA66548.1 hypothetical protein [Tanacetum cinerariifolium]
FKPRRLKGRLMKYGTKKLSIFLLKGLGCKALVKRDTLDKLDPKSIKCIFVGYPKETIGYYFYYPLENKICVAQNTKFFENSLMVQEASGSHGLLESSESDEGLELIQEEDTQPSENTSKVHNEVTPIEVEPQNVKVPICRSARIPQASDRHGFYVDVEKYEVGDLNVPPNYKAALSDSEFDKWLKDMNTEMQSMKDNQVWVLVDLPPNGRTVGNYGETFSHVANIRAIRILLAIAAFYDYEIWQMDVKTAFLNGHLSEDIYMMQPKGFVDPKYPKFNMRSDVLDPMLPLCKICLVIFSKNPDEIHWTAVKNILKYLRNTKISTTAMSFTEAEYIDVVEASMEAIWMRKFIDGLGNVVPSNKKPMGMPGDNEHAIVIANDLKILKGTKHFQRKYHYIREVIEEREIVLKKVHTYDNIADPFTKPMSFNKHYEHAMTIGIVPASSLM